MILKKFTAAALSICMGLSGLPLQAAERSETTLQELLHLSFEDNVTDSSAHANEAVVHGTMDYVQGVSGKALHITNEHGSSSAAGENYLQFPEAGSLQLGSDDFSISLWYKSSSGTEDGGAIITNKDYASGGNDGFALGSFTSNVRANFTPQEGSRHDLYDVSSIDGAWHHIVVTYDRDGMMSAWRDGELVKQTDISDDAGKSIDFSTMSIGADCNGSYALLDSSIDELYVYSGLLQEEDIQRLYDAGDDEVLYLNFDAGNAMDQSGSGHDGNAVNVTYDEGVLGKGAHIVNPEGSSSADAVSYIDLGDQIHLGAEDFTISFWYQSSTGNESGGTVISAKDYNSGSNDGFAIGSFTDELRVNLAFDGTRKDIYFTPVDGQWHHSAVTFDRDGLMSAYTDGALVSTSDISAFAGKSVDIGSLVIGADGYLRNALLDSVIDEVKIFTSAKSAEQIRDLYEEVHSQISEPLPEDGEVLYAAFDGNSEDSSGRGNHGSAQGDVEYVEGIRGSALHIVNENGSTSAKAEQYVDFGNRSDLKFGSEDFSLTYWVRSDNGESSGGALISNKDWSSGSNQGFTVGNFDNGFRVNFTAQGSSRRDLYGISPIDGEWHFMVINFDRDGQMTSYMDGVQSVSADISADAGRSIDVTNFVVGADGYFCNGLNDALIDELHVYKGLQDPDSLPLRYAQDLLAYTIARGSDLAENAKHYTFFDPDKIKALEDAVTEAQALQDGEDHDAIMAAISAVNEKMEELQEGMPEIVDGLMLHASFDEEDAKDESGRANHGSVHGEVEYVSGVSGKAIHIVNDNGSSTETAQQYVNFGQAEDLRFGTEDFTLAFWYRSAQGGASEGALLSNKDWTSGSNQGFTVGNFTNGLRVNYTAQGHGRDDIYGLGANDDAWHFIVIGFDRDGDMTAWVDNEEAGSASISDTLGSTIDYTDLVLGADGEKRYGMDDVTVDELRVYKRLISSEERSELYYADSVPMQIEQMQQILDDALSAGTCTKERADAFQKAIDQAHEAADQAAPEEMRAILDRLNIAYETFASTHEDPIISFEVLSDVHVNGSEDSVDTNANLIDALQDIQVMDPNSSAILFPGDITNSGSAAQYDAFFDIIDRHASTYPMVALGNHDVRWLCSSEDRNEAGLRIPTCQAGTNPFKERYLEHNQKYMGDVPEGQLYFDQWIDGYHFITLNTEEDLKDQAYLSDAQISWLDTVLEGSDPDQPIFIQIHQTFQGTADHEELDWIGGESEEKLKEVLRDHPQAVIFTGHVHNGIDLADVFDRDFGHVVDVPCFWYSSYGDAQAQIGYQVNVYDDGIEIRVRDYLNDVWMDEYTMWVDLDAKDPTTDKYDLPTADMQASAGSEHADSGVEGPASNLLDDDESTIWHTVYGGTPMENRWVEIALERSTLIDGLRYLPRKVGTNGTILGYEIWLSNDEGETWTKVSEGRWKGSATWKAAAFEPQHATNIRLQATDTIGNYGSGAELRITAPAAEIDKSALNEAIAAAEALDGEDYTTNSWNVLASALETAKTVAADDNAAQTEIDDAANALNGAKAALQVKASKAAIDALQNVVDKANALQEDSLAGLIAAAQALLDDPANASVTAVVSAMLELSEAMADLNTGESTDALRADVQATIDFIKEHILNNVEGLRPGKVQALKDAVAAAEELLASGDATADELKAANEAMTKAAQELWEIVSKAELNALIEAANGYLDGDYTMESLEALQAAITAAQTVAANDDATTAEVTEAITNLSDAIANLKTITLDTSALEHEIELVTEMIANLDNYVLSSVEGLQEKLDAAKTALSNATTQEEIDEAAKTLREARLNARTKADTSALEEIIAYANSLDLRSYSKDSADAVLALAKRAQEMTRDPNISQEEVDALAVELQRAIDDLHPAGSTVTKEPDTAAEAQSMLFGIMLMGAAAGLLRLRRKTSRS